MRPKTYLRLIAILVLISLAAVASLAQTRAGNRRGRGSTAAAQQRVAIARIWHGRTRSERADEYYRYLYEEGVRKIEAIKGNLGVQVLRRTEGDVTEFTVISYWVSRDAIRRFAGEDIEKTHHLPRDAEYLLELEPFVRHFEVVFDKRR